MSSRFTWRLEDRMHQSGIHSGAQLRDALAGEGISLSTSQIHRLIKQRPERLNLEVLAALCHVCDCRVEDLISVHARENQSSARKVVGSKQSSIRSAAARPPRARIVEE